MVPLEGDKLCVGDKLPLVATLPKDFETTVVLCNKEYTLDRRMGRFVGAQMAKTAMNVPLEGLEEWQCDDRVPEFAYSAPDEFTMGLLESFLLQEQRWFHRVLVPRDGGRGIVAAAAVRHA